MFCNKCYQNSSNPDICEHCGNQLTNNKTKTRNKSEPNNDSIKKIIFALLAVANVVLVVLVVLKYAKDDQTPGSGNNELAENTRTVMIYVVGSNLESVSKIVTGELEGIIPEEVDLDNMNVLLYTGGTEVWHNFISNQENGLYQLKKDGFEKIKSYERRNMGAPSTLNDLLTYGYENYKTDKYDLILYDHGGAIQGAIYDDFTQDLLTLDDFKTALNDSPFSKDNKLETVLFRTCLNGTIEVANTFKDYASYLVASEEVTVGYYPLSVLSFLNDIDKKDKAIDYGKKFISSYEKQIEKLKEIGFNGFSMYSIIDLNHIDELDNKINDFFKDVNVLNNYNSMVRLRSSLFQFAYNVHGESGYDTVDLYSLINGLSSILGKNVDDFNKAYNDAVVYNWSNLDEAKGLSVFFPYNGTSTVQQLMLSLYNSIDFSDTYYKFIKDFYELNNSKKSTSFVGATFSKDNIKVTDNEENGKKFTIELSEKQKDEYAKSIYIVFRKTSEGKYTPVYSSDNAELKGNKLTTNIGNNLIKVHDASDNSESYVTLVQRGHGSEQYLTSVGVVYDMDSDIDDIAKFMQSAKYTYDFDKDGNPYIKNIINISKNKSNSVSTIGTSLIDKDKIDVYDFLISDYDILDKDGKYNSNWDNKGISKYFEVRKDNMSFKKATLDDGDYYCVFRILDVYGNSVYTDLIGLN